MHELFDVLGHRVVVSGDRLAVDDGTTRLSYARLAARIAAAAEDLRSLMPSPAVVGILGGNQADWIVGQLAGWHAGKTVVPLAPFFHAAQLRHVIGDAGITHVLATADMLETAKLLGVPVTPLGKRETAFIPPAGPEGRQIIYTSGSTGRPKGVMLAGRQMMWSARALATAIHAGEDDSYLSVLPLALLLETLAAVVMPLLAGAPVRLEPGLAARFGDLDGTVLSEAIASRRPTCMVLVPQLLARWVSALRDAGARAPDSLRFVAVGGAAVPPRLAREAWNLGIPVHEGYGLSECGSVVALNRPGDRASGTVGRPLSGLDIRIEEGEIVVSGPSVMEHYVHGASPGGVWRTGDVGEIGSNGRLTVRGRLDNVIVTPMGRNISPEWIEALLAADPRIAHCVVTHIEGPHLTACLVPAAQGEDWFVRASLEDIAALVAGCCAEVPAYAVPRQFIVVSLDDLLGAGALTGNGRVRRDAVLELCVDLLDERGASGNPRRVFG